MALFADSTGNPYEGKGMATLIGPETYFHGVINVRGSLHVEGEVEGSIHEAQEVVIGGNGKVTGDIAAEVVKVAGTVRGDIVASGFMEIKAGGKVLGNIRTGRLAIHDGAVFEGQCAMGAPEAAAAEEAAEEEDVPAAEEVKETEPVGT